VTSRDLIQPETLPLTRPDPLPVRYRVLSNVVWAPVFFTGTAVFGSLSLLASLVDKDGRKQHRIAQAWASFGLWIASSPVTVIGAENLPTAGPAVYAANHVSYMDTPVLFSALRFQFRILAKQGLWKVPFIGWHLDRSGQIPVNTDNPKASISSLLVGVRALKAGMPLVVFPEGGRALSGHPGAFASGPAYMAVRAQVPLVPMAIVGTYELLPMHTRHFFPRPLALVVGKPIATTGYSTKGIEELTERLSGEISRLYYAHANRQPPTAQEEPQATSHIP
jgi:1-acyl-sn-glycerol-3-phosphate acyltransferase